MIIKKKPSAKSLFSEDLDDLPPRIIAIHHGFEKSGKTGLALDAPGHIKFLTCDPSYLLPVRNAQRMGKKISVAKFMWSPPPKEKASDKNFALHVKEESGRLFSQFEEAYFQAHEDSLDETRTIICDNGTTFFQMCQAATHGKIHQILPRDRGKSNDRMDRLYTLSQNYDKNVIWIHRTKEIWKDDKPTGIFKPEGYKWAGNAVQVIIENTRKPGTKRFRAKITDCAFDANCIGEVFEEEELRFKNIASMLLKVDEEEFDDGVELW